MRYIIATILFFALAVTVPAYPLYQYPALAAPKGENSLAAIKNSEGINAYGKQMYPEAEIYFRDALRIDPGFAEAHYNLALVLHERRYHSEAAVEFKKAKDLAKGNKEILTSRILLHHVSML